MTMDVCVRVCICPLLYVHIVVCGHRCPIVAGSEEKKTIEGGVNDDHYH